VYKVQDAGGQSISILVEQVRTFVIGKTRWKDSERSRPLRKDSEDTILHSPFNETIKLKD
jgi:hypothetical protein